MTDPLQLLLLVGVGILAGFLNVMAGGGSTITLPLLIFMGMDSTLANGTNRVAILMQNISAVTSFRRQEHSRFRQSMLFALFTIPGAIAGAFFAARISDELFQRILAIVMIGVIISLFVTPSGRREESQEQTGFRALLIYPAMFAIGFYGGFIQVGVGFIFMAALYHLLKLSLAFVNMHKVFIVLVYTIPALLVFAWGGHVAWVPGILLGAGNAVGGWWAARAAVRKGDKLIRAVLVVAIFVMAVKLLGVF
ncbi:MAG: sulfite exporter TauE/SafE family protein [Ignavibacteria bacterium]|nr:sulfite exporter TauE/SafE family protein [Ignavibacteria bacterium]